MISQHVFSKSTTNAPSIYQKVNHNTTLQNDNSICVQDNTFFLSAVTCWITAKKGKLKISSLLVKL